MLLKLLLVILGFVSQVPLGCGMDQPLDDIHNGTPTIIYQKSIEDLKSQSYKSAISELKKIAFYPLYNDIYQSSIALLAYAYCMYQEYQLCIDTVDRYLQFYPQSNKKDGLLYLKGMAYYNLAMYRKSIFFQHKNYLNYYHFYALDHFENMLRAYPESKFTPQIKDIIRQLQNVIVDSKLDVAHVYHQNYKNLAAINILYSLLEQYPDSDLIPEVLYHIMSIYMYWGMSDSGQGILEYLQNKFTDSFWLKEAQVLHKQYTT